MPKESVPNNKQSFFEKKEDSSEVVASEKIEVKESVRQAQDKQEKTVEEGESSPKKKKFQKLSAYFPSNALTSKPTKKAQYLLFFVVLGLAIAASIFFFLKYQEVNNSKSDSSQNTPSAKEIKQLVGKVEKLIELPKNETPTIATITDPTKLESQVFFRNSKKGDKVLIFGSTQMAYLYRPSINKLINVAPISANPEQASDLAPTSEVTPAPSVTPSPTPTPTTSQKISVVLWNGTTKAGLTKTAEANLKAKNDNIDVVDRDNASSSTYAKTLVIDISGKNKSQADALATLTGGSVVSLPADETKPVTGTILVILGADYK